MKYSSLALLLFLASAAQAADHNNLDSGRPLDFDDAQSIAFGERALESGVALAQSQSGKTGATGSVELLYGFAKNSHFALGFDPRYEDENGGRRLEGGDVELSFFHSLNREHGNTPAFALRADAILPTGRDSTGVDFRLRGIASRHVARYDRVHLNLDLIVNSSAGANERKAQPGLILGYSRPLGFPVRFDRTFVAQIAYRVNALKGQSSLTTIGVGLRQQVSPRAVVDVGITSDVTGGAERETLKLVAGYSTQF